MITVPVVPGIVGDQDQSPNGNGFIEAQVATTPASHSAKPRGAPREGKDAAPREGKDAAYQWHGGAPLQVKPGQAIAVPPVSPLRSSMNLEPAGARASTASYRNRRGLTERFRPRRSFGGGLDDSMSLSSQPASLADIGTSCLSSTSHCSKFGGPVAQLSQGSMQTRPSSPSQRPSSPLAISPFRQQYQFQALHQPPSRAHGSMNPSRGNPCRGRHSASFDSQSWMTQSFWSKHDGRSPVSRASTAPEFQSPESVTNPQTHRTEVLRRHRELESRRGGRLRALGNPPSDVLSVGSFPLPQAPSSDELSQAWTATSGQTPSQRPWTMARNRPPKYHPRTVFLADDPTFVRLL